MRYELRRLMYNKKYFYMSLILCINTIDTLMRNIIEGTYSTAPFSKWSYSDFIGVTTPFLLIILIFLCITVFDEKEEAMKRIIFATPFSKRKYYFLKASSIGVVFLITALIPIVISFVYYIKLFDYYDFGEFIKPILLFLLPPFIFILGLSMALGKINVKLLYIMVPMIYFTCGLNLGFPVWMDLCGNNFILEYGLYLSVESFSGGNIPYDIPSSFIYSRLVFAVLGVALFLMASRNNKTQVI